MKKAVANLFSARDIHTSGVPKSNGLKSNGPKSNGPKSNASLDATSLGFIAGPCVAESMDLCLQVADFLVGLQSEHGERFVFKASFDKANRTSDASYRGPGLERGLEILAEVRRHSGLPVLTDVHSPQHVEAVAEVVDVLQIPAFLCRQTDLLAAAAATGKPVNIKKGQFLAPEDMAHAVAKHRRFGEGPVAVTERGTSFGYHTLVVDMTGLEVMAEACKAPVIFDATHAVQKPSVGAVSGGDRRRAPGLARAAVAVGAIDGVFCEIHPNPDAALSDAANCLSLPVYAGLVRELLALHACVGGVV